MARMAVPPVLKVLVAMTCASSPARVNPRRGVSPGVRRERLERPLESRGARLGVVLDLRVRRVLLDALDGALGRGFGRIALGLEDDLGVVFEADAELARFV